MNKKLRDAKGDGPAIWHYLVFVYVMGRGSDFQQFCVNVINVLPTGTCTYSTTKIKNILYLLVFQWITF